MRNDKMVLATQSRTVEQDPAMDIRCPGSVRFRNGYILASELYRWQRNKTNDKRRKNQIAAASCRISSPQRFVLGAGAFRCCPPTKNLLNIATRAVFCSPRAFAPFARVVLSAIRTRSIPSVRRRDLRRDRCPARIPFGGA